MFNAFKYLDYMRYDNTEVDFVAQTFCNGNHRVFIEWMPNGDYFFKIRPTNGYEYGTDRMQLYHMVNLAEKQARYNDRKLYASIADTRNYYSY